MNDLIEALKQTPEWFEYCASVKEYKEKNSIELKNKMFMSADKLMQIEEAQKLLAKSAKVYIDKNFVDIKDVALGDCKEFVVDK